MDFRSAVQTAKNFVKQIYADEDVTALGLEELEHDADDDVWTITIGFNKPTAAGRTGDQVSSLTSLFYGDRRFKVVRFRGDGSLISLKDRILEQAT